MVFILCDSYLLHLARSDDDGPKGERGGWMKRKITGREATLAREHAPSPVRNSTQLTRPRRVALLFIPDPFTYTSFERNLMNTQRRVKWIFHNTNK
jgi:hypothetical protein